MDYQDLVRQIVDAERSAQAIARDAQDQQTAQEAALKQELAEIRVTAMTQAQAKVDEIRERMKTSAQKELSSWDEKLSSAMAIVENSNRTHHEEWVETLFRMITEDVS